MSMAIYVYLPFGFLIVAICIQDKLKATAEDRAKAAEQVELLQQSLSRVSAECEAMKKEKESVEQLLKATRQRLKTKVDECNTFEVSD